MKRDRKNIALSSREKAALERIKRSYDRRRDRRSDWGDFLIKALPFALVALGIYHEVKMRRGQSMVICPACEREFAVAVPASMPEELVVSCPHCEAELVIGVTDEEYSD